jgi:hypothetical protein
VATYHHRTLSLDPFAERLIAYLDGSRDRPALLTALTADLGESGVLAGYAGAAGHDPRRLTGLVAKNLDRLLTLLARQGLLSA